jgi:SAM-dependent methyltransferase
VLDIGCHSGLFSLDLAARGAAHVDGIDLRPENIAQAEFAARHYGIENVSFAVRDADHLDPGASWDVVLNLGLLYHVLDPFALLARTYEVCGSFAVIDTVCHSEPVSAYFVFGDKDVASRGEGRASYELHPTYRAAIETIRHAGFSEVFEVVARCDKRPQLYGRGERRCFLAIK